MLRCPLGVLLSLARVLAHLFRFVLAIGFGVFWTWLRVFGCSVGDDLPEECTKEAIASAAVAATAAALAVIYAVWATNVVIARLAYRSRGT